MIDPGIERVAAGPAGSVYTRGNCIAVVGTTQGGTGLLTERGLGYLIWRDGQAFLKSKSAIVLVRHHPLPQLRNERLAVAAVTNGDHEFVGICRQLSCRICPLLAPFARWKKL